MTLLKTHITLISLNFYPEDTAIGLYSTQLAEYLEEKGALVSVITAFPYYPKWKISDDYINKKTYYQEKKGSIHIYRYKQFTPQNPTFLKRVAHIVDFTIGSRLNFKQIKKCDIVISIIPFTSSAWLGNMLSRKRNAKHWIHIQDFEFDAAFQSGITSSENKGFTYKKLMRLEQNILNKADTVSTISHTMLEKLKNKTTSKAYYLPNWVDAKKSNPRNTQVHPYFSDTKFSILYAGNVGDKQDWNFFENFIASLNIDYYEVIVVGAGARMETLKKNEALKNVTFYDPVPLEELASLLASADVHILFQKTTVIDTVMPSKILGMMASSKPSIITGHQDAEPAKIINTSGAGFYSSEPLVEVIIQQLELLRSDPDKAEEMGIKARDFVITQYNKEKILSAFHKAITTL